MNFKREKGLFSGGSQSRKNGRSNQGEGSFWVGIKEAASTGKIFMTATETQADTKLLMIAMKGNTSAVGKPFSIIQYSRNNARSFSEPAFVDSGF